MAKLTKDEMLKIVNDSISAIENKNFKLYFFVLDTKGTPSSALEYIYQTAFTLKNKGYDVAMLHNEKEFIGVGDWMGEEYANLKHYYVEKENVEITVNDYLFIPEIFANVMITLKKMPCKKIMIVQNYSNITEFMPVSVTPEALGIIDAIAISEAQSEGIKRYFPRLRTHVVSPSIKPFFKPIKGQKKLVVNVICKDQSKVNQMIKPFYWNNPMYRWVSINDLRGLSQQEFAQMLGENAITIWADDSTTFGYSLLEALRCGSIVLAKVPENPSEWMIDKESNELTPNILWFDTYDEIGDYVTALVRSWTKDEIPDSVYEGMKAFDNMYTEFQQNAEIEQVYEKEIIGGRLAEFKEVKAQLENNTFNTAQ